MDSCDFSPRRLDMGIVRNGKTLLTYEDYVQIPEDGRRHEIIEGIHYVTPSPATKHQQVSIAIAVQLYDQIERPGLGLVIYAPMDVVFSRIDVVQPDLLVILNRNRRIVKRKNVRGSPDLIVEITSPSTVRRDLELKRSLYEKYRVPEYWIVHTHQNVVDRLVLGPRGYRQHGRCRRRIEFGGLPGVVVDLRQVW
jgi:Uma2 family endonuclease